MKEKQQKNPGKKPYKAPKLITYGSIRKFTRTTSAGTMSDGGTAPRTMRTCIGTISEIEEHRMLLQDTVMQQKFRRAIQETVRPGDTVLDLGTGSGLHALFACQAGAAKVYAVDSGPIIELAREAARDNGYADRIECIFGDSSEIELPEKVDVIITNVGFLGTLESLPDARRRFLKEDGRIIPGRIQLSFAPVDGSEIYAEKIEPWSADHFGLSFKSFRSYAANKPLADHFTPECYLAPPVALPAIDLGSDLPELFHWGADYTLQREGTLHGLAGWYSFALTETVSMSTEPPLTLSPEIWRHPFLPLEQPIAVQRGDAIRVQLGFFPQIHGDDPVWTWSVEINGVRVEQSSFRAVPLSKQLLRKLDS